jgi:hypothetical protein
LSDNHPGYVSFTVIEKLVDTTVSRHHADLSVMVSTFAYSQDRINSTLVLKDVSKFVQTTLNGKLLTCKQREVALNPGDVVQFGACPDTFSVEYRNFVACFSDFGNRPEYQSLAFRTGLPVSNSIIDSSVFIAEEIQEENLEVCVSRSSHSKSTAHTSGCQMCSSDTTMLLREACGNSEWCPEFTSNSGFRVCVSPETA